MTGQLRQVICLGWKIHRWDKLLAIAKILSPEQVFDVLNFDLFVSIKLPYTPGCADWIFKASLVARPIVFSFYILFIDNVMYIYPFHFYSEGRSEGPTCHI